MRINGQPCRLHAEIDGTKIEPGPIKASEAERILDWTGYERLQAWELRVTDCDPLALRALLALMRFREGEHVKIGDVEVHDLDSCWAELRDERGRVARIVVDEKNEPKIVKGELVWEFDGEPVDPPTPQPSLDD